MLTNPYVTSVENEIHRREWLTVRGRQGHASVGGSRRVVPQLTLRDTGVALVPAGLWHGWSDQTTVGLPGELFSPLTVQPGDWP